MPENITGSCLCKSVKYVITGDIKSVLNCHCNTCKKITGGAFATIAITKEINLEITEGQNCLTSYQISENSKKHFCGTCGTPIYNLHTKYPGFCMVQVGSFDNPSLVSPTTNIFCESMRPWVKKIAALKCFEQLPTR